MSSIPYGRQDINQSDIDAVIAVLRSDFLTQGPAVPLFEKSIIDYCGVEFAIAVNSATSALHMACLALGVGRGDIVWTTSITFVASANCALYCGASIDFVDIDPRTYNMSLERLEEKLIEAEKIAKLPKVVIPVHLCGQACDMLGIHHLSQKYGFKIIEDASHAIGGKYSGDPIGNCRYSDITVFSFHPVKIITTGEGGMALTNNAQLAKQLRILRSHGISTLGADMQPRPSNEIWNYQQIDLGFNYRMTDIQAALGASQMARLDSFVEKRHSIAKRYDIELAELPIRTPWQFQDSYSAYHLYPILILPNQSGISQRQAYHAMQEADIKANLHYIPVYRQPYYESIGFEAGYCPNAEKYFQQAISIPIYPTLSDAEQTKVIRTLHKILV
jgi:UDP-4-amino-4,6-dideoxy-N-acetyl-beta-L-altrosamine transaminase